MYSKKNYLKSTVIIPLGNEANASDFYKDSQQEMYSDETTLHLTNTNKLTHRFKLETSSTRGIYNSSIRTFTHTFTPFGIIMRGSTA